MLCSKCGTMNSEEAAFCKNCGVSLIAEEVQTTDTVEEITENPVISIIKKIASSGLFMAGAICLSVYAFLQFISALSSNFMIKYIELMTNFALIDVQDPTAEATRNAFNALGTGITSISLIGIIPIALIVAGVWYFFSAAKKEGNVNTKGLKLIKGALIYEIVMLSVVSGIVLLLMLVLIAVLGSNVAFLGQTFDFSQFAGAEALSTGIIISLVSFVLVIVAASFVINLITYVKALKTVKSVNEALSSGAFIGNVSMYLIIMLFIMGAINALSFSLTGLSSGAAYIIFGICLNQLREELSRQA